MIRLQALLLVVLLGLTAGLARAEDLPISSGDRLNVVVTGETELCRIYTVDQDGSISIPLVGSVPVKGKFPSQVRDDLTKRLAKYVKGPQVTVEFQDRAQITVGFTGMVTKPGPVMLKKGSRLLDALAQAQGLTMDADRQHVRLQRRGEPQPRALDLSELDKDAKLNVELEEGDAIDVPRIPTNTLRVLGAVNKPGDFQRKERATLLDAILTSGGLNPDADRRKVQILRRNAAMPELVNLDDVLSGKAPQPLLADGDVVTIPAFDKVAVKVFGSVAKPGETTMRTGTTLVEAITVSGGFAMDADRRSVLLTAPNGDVKKVSLERLDGPEGALVLEDGVRVFVPQAAVSRFAVTGGVANPGMYPLPTDGKSRVFLTDALAQAGGPTDRAMKNKVYVVRKNAKGEPETQEIDYEAYLKKKDPKLNPEIMASDVVYVDQKNDRDPKKQKPLEKILGLAGAIFGL